MTPETAGAYLRLLERLFVVEPAPPWTPRLRSRARLGANQERLMRDLPTTGLLFESALAHDLMVFASAAGGKVWHYRDSNGHQADAVVTLPDGRWGMVEAKLGGRQALAP